MSWQSSVYFLGWAALFTMMMRVGCGAHVMGHRRREPQKEADLRARAETDSGPPAVELRDPVYGMHVTVGAAKPVVYRDHTYYFCSATCREKFEAAPTQYSSSLEGPASSKERHHGCC